MTKEEREYDNSSGFIKNLKLGIRVRISNVYYTKIREDGDKAIVLVERKEK